jgi:hypothetical protein
MKAKKMDRPVTIHEMENVIGGLDIPDFSISNDIGNIIEISDSSDTLGLGMLTNPGRHRGGSGGGGGSGGDSSSSIPMGGSGGGLAEVEIGGLDTVEPITLNIGGGSSGLGGMASGSSAPIEFEIKRSGMDGGGFGGGSSGGGGGLFSNSQTATGPGYGLAAAQSPTRMSQEEERAKKFDYINKLQRLEQKGFQVSKRYTMDNTLDEMKQEYDRLVDARNLEASLRFQRQALMSVVTGMEWANGRFDPFDLKLDGWSEAVHENVEDFDEIFEELYDKYKERGKMPPEARLVMALAGSGFMCHVSNSFLKSKMSNVSADDILKNNPDLARQFAAAAANQAGSGFGNFMGMAMGGGGAAATAAPVGGGAGSMFGSSAAAAAQAASEAKARAAAEVAFQQQSRGNGGAPMAQVPQNVAAMEAPRATARREMRGPSGVDDILRQFEEARRNEGLDGTAAFPSEGGLSAQQQPATMAAIEIQSMASGDDIGSAAESTRTGRGRGGRRRAPVGNVMSLEI